MFVERIKGITWVEITVVAAIVLIGTVATAVIWTRFYREPSWARSCQENLLSIEGAVDQWVMDNSKADGSTVTMRILVSRSQKFKKTPRCPCGKSYDQVFTAGVTPTCNYTPPAWFNTQGRKYLHRIPDIMD